MNKLKVGDKVTIIANDDDCKDQTGIVRIIARTATNPIGVRLDKPRKDSSLRWSKENWVDFPMKYFWIGKEKELQVDNNDLNKGRR